MRCSENRVLRGIVEFRRFLLRIDIHPIRRNAWTNCDDRSQD